MKEFARHWEPTPIGLYAWEPPRPEESAQGLLLRIAEMHGHSSTDRTAACIAVNRSRMAHGDAGQIEKFAAAIRQDPAALKADSVLRGVDGRLKLRGQDLTDFINFGVRRLCPGCLAESKHHRFWWDIRSISTCPRHGLKLVDRCDCAADARLGWRSGGLLHCSRCGSRGLRPAAVPADPMVLRTDSYLLSRLGAGDTDPVPVLDALRLKDVCLTLERVGSASRGYSREWQSAASAGVSLESVQALGFQILADGGLDDVLTRIYDGFIAAGGRPEQGFSSCYGWFYQWFNHKRGVKFSPILAQAFLHHGAARFPIVPKSGLGTLSAPKRKKLSLKAAAAVCGASLWTMRNIGIALGVTRVEKKSGSQISFPVEVVEGLAADLKRACSLLEAKRKLGIGGKVLHQLVQERLLVPALAGGGKHRHIYIFRQDDIEALLRKLAEGGKLVAKPSAHLTAIAHFGRGRSTTVADCIRRVLDREIDVVERVPGAIGLRALYVDQQKVVEVAARSSDGKGVTLDAAARKMRLNRRGMRRAIALGLLPGVKRGATRIPDRVVSDFAEKYIMLSEVRLHLGGRFAELKKLMRRMGFGPDPQLARCLHVGFARNEVETFLAGVAAGRISLALPETKTAHQVLVAAVERLLAKAAKPVPTDELLGTLRREIKLGPSDQKGFFYSAMWKERTTFLHITGAGWWLRERPYLGRTLGVEREAVTQTGIADETVLELLRATDRPIPPNEITARLKERSIEVPMVDEFEFLRRLAVRHADKIVKLTGLGYWDRSRPYPPALYDPATWSGHVQTSAQRIGLWTIKLLNDLGRPLSRTELEPPLRERGVIPAQCSRAYLANAVAERSDEIVYLKGIGYWLRRRPWPAAGYQPRIRKRAA